MSTPPQALIELVRAWDDAGRPPQPGVPWPRQAWIDAFGSDATVFEGLPDLIDRAAVRAACSKAPESPEGSRRAFLASMAWGYGRVGYGRHRTAEALANTPDAIGRLHAAAQCLANEGALAAYRLLANENRICGLGPAFGTKFLYFCPQAEDGRPALILDQIVATWLRSNTAEKWNPVPWSTRTYERYLDLICDWADQLEISPATVEERIFVSSATGQWSAK